MGDSQTLTLPVVVTGPQAPPLALQLQVEIVRDPGGVSTRAKAVPVVYEGAAPIEGQLAIPQGMDLETVRFSIAEGVAAPAGFVLDEDGSYHFDPAHEAYDPLNVGDYRSLTIPISVTDEAGTTHTAQVRLVIRGTNDAPVASASVRSIVDEGAGMIAGRVTATDVDDEAVVFSIADGMGPPPGFVLLENGQYAFDPGHEAYNSLNVGETRVLTIPVMASDPHGASDTTEIRITVVGTNDAPVAETEFIAHVHEGDALITGLLSAADSDAGARLRFSVSEGAQCPAGFTLNPDGSYRFDPRDPAYRHLGPGESESYSVPVTVTRSITSRVPLRRFALARI
ncbi:MAG: hypothetical protein B0D87_08385 [Candidatus Sedimenticola endophacoides]|nr:MAG: hypothetical protein B0D87_08385 [Candidatus Sedimenticola endophacoides]